MSVTRIGLSCLVGLLGSLGMAQAQGLPSAGNPQVLPLTSPNGVEGTSPYSPSAAPGQSEAANFGSAVAVNEGPIPPATTGPVSLGLPASPWLVYPRSPCCCGPVGHCGGPIGSEVFVRSGIAFPVGGGIFGKYLHPGWDIEGGARVLFFNPQVDKAWTVSLSVSNIFNRTGDANQPIDLFNVPVKTTVEVPGQTNIPGSLRATTPATVNVPHLQATVSSLNQTFVNLGGGREWWLLGSADPGQQHGCNWRVGVDGGGRYGTAMVQFNEINHHTDAIGGLYCAIHTDVEYPWRCGILFGGIRYEYNYIWTSILQSQNNGDYQSMNLLFQIGSRF
ncbi:MAG TPA: hypothetical protein VN688_00885 [Gemmataceae bacterium]|nr:hypothetical protein [Gemmataceae bacterium]